MIEAGQEASVSVSAVLSAERRRPLLAPVPLGTLVALRKVYEDRGIRFFQTSSGERGIQIAVL